MSMIIPFRSFLPITIIIIIIIIDVNIILIEEYS